MTRLFSVLIVLAFAVASPAPAQQQVFIQIEAQPNLSQARQSLRSYANRFGDLNGFELRTGWFGIALGPYAAQEAQSVLNSLRNAQLIPGDSYIAQPGDFRSQFWPEDGSVLQRTAIIETPQVTLSQAEDSADIEPEETLREARANEARLSRDERAEVQKALAWAGFYRGGIDAAFGPGTRQAMSRWQEAQAFPPTGVLTTRQRLSLLQAYNAVLEGLELARVEDTQAGISLTVPTGLVAFSRYEAPFAHYDARDDAGDYRDARVLLISQSGTRATLAGLYDVLQTLDIVPLTGARELRRDDFTITGQDARRSTHIEARLENGAIKGFAIVWPADDEARRLRVLQIMQDSFSSIEGVLDPKTGAETAGRIDLLAGLEIRQPVRARSGFFIDPRGWVITTEDAVAGCTRVTLDRETEAQLEALDQASGIALLRPQESLAPARVARFAPETPRLRSDVAVAGYSYGGTLGAPSVTFGTLADLTGLQGEPDIKRLALNVLESDAGGPVLSDAGAVLGLLLPKADEGRVLPDDVNFAAGPDKIRRFLTDAGITPVEAPSGDPLPPETLRREASGMTVLVSCWE